MRTCIIWFRNDLRLNDNEVVRKAVKEFDRVIPVYILDQKNLCRTSYGFRKIGLRRMKFILESLDNLNQNLNKCGSRLIVLTGKPAEQLKRMAQVSGAKTILAHKEIASEEIISECDVINALKGVASLQLIWGNTLFHIDDLPMDIAQLPDIFTEFRKKAEKFSVVRTEIAAPTIIPFPEINLQYELPLGQIPTLEELRLPQPADNTQDNLTFAGGENEAINRLKHYTFETHSIASYKETRNGLTGADYSSKFSPWLAQGCISPKTIYYEVRRYENEVVKNESTYWIVFELLWRDYFRFVLLKYGNKLFRKGGIRNTPPEIVSNESWLNAWTDGRTGIPFIDANMRELKATGFMSNRGRQNVASFFVKDLKLDWREGAAWFEQELIDYDVSSNWGNWAYIAGVGNDSRSDRYFNIMLQAERYDAEGDYVKQWIPQLKGLPKYLIHKPWILNQADMERLQLNDTPYARPIVVPQRW
jgi:deoxyribodipyrimidine photo-lyase